MDLVSTGGNNHLSFASDQVKIAIVIKPAHIACSNPVGPDEGLLFLTCGTFAIAGSNTVFANGYYFAIGRQLDTNAGEWAAHGTNLVGTRNIESNPPKFSHAVSFEQRQLHQLKQLQ